MDFDAWNVDLATSSAFHVTGFRITVEGNLTQPTGVSPSHFPAGLSAVEQARLLRSGMKALMRAAQNAKVCPQLVENSPEANKKKDAVLQRPLFEG